MKILRSLYEVKTYRATLKASVGFVPTMGALHAGHRSLLQRARSENEICLLSIFVNPTQFNNPEDLLRYPRHEVQDLELAAQQKVDAVFLPTVEEMYPPNDTFRIEESQLSHLLCGAFRPGHFSGVLTVVMKLFQLVRPTRAYFGEKDFQQLHLIRGMVESFFLPVKVVACPTVREADGLAMSSRNLRLTSEEREHAPLLFKTLRGEPDLQLARQKLEQEGFYVDYLTEQWGRRFVAAHLGSVRLIDNVEVL